MAMLDDVGLQTPILQPRTDTFTELKTSTGVSNLGKNQAWVSTTLSLADNKPTTLLRPSIVCLKRLMGLGMCVAGIISMRLKFKLHWIVGARPPVFT